MELRTLWHTETVEVLVSAWDRTQHPAERSGATHTAVIEFVHSGSYARRTACQDFLVDVNRVAFFNPHETLRFSHPCGESNAGMTLRVRSAYLPEILGTRIRKRYRQIPFLRPFALTSPRCHLLQSLLSGVLTRQVAGGAALIEELLMALIREAGRGQTTGNANAHERSQQGTDRVGRIRRYLLDHWSERLTLRELAEVAGCSPWHLAEVFRAEVGLPLHGYLKRLRLRQALGRLADSRADLTYLALECGFHSHSHFSASFRQEFGITPSFLRSAWLTPAALRRVLHALGGHTEERQ